LKQKATFLTLSPDEEHILNGNKPKPETSWQQILYHAQRELWFSPW